MRQDKTTPNPGHILKTGTALLRSAGRHSARIAGDALDKSGLVDRLKATPIWTMNSNRVRRRRLERLELTFIDLPATRREVAEIETEAAALARSAAWSDLADMLQDFEDIRSDAPGLLRLYDSCATAARMALADDIAPPDDLTLAPVAGIADPTLDELEGAHVRDRSNHILAALAARAHIDAAWYHRSGSADAEIPDERWEAMRLHYDRAAQILAEFDPHTHNSPLLAEAFYFLALDAEDPASALHRAFETWTDLDPANVTPYLTHGFHLLPRWGGSYEHLHGEAACSARNTKELLGGGAYTAFHVIALLRDDEAIAGLDVDRFVDGLHDLLDYDLNDPDTANNFAGMLYAVSKPRLPGPETPADSPAPRRREEMREALREFIDLRLGGLRADAWGEPGDAEAALADLFAEQLDAGNRLILDKHGLRFEPLKPPPEQA
ncbi:hypothetical protein [Pelagovum pacificum]|uniref:DUF4034 domain-containing protein n=1 Tax=Pelagovum pacificum TaxID=2588711 RepID=A0A5C5G7M6_9RHOB|nr:hypothetical protein [Pelagovum pacificum]QQA41795.1 hypothetical protein I8N54_13410 [Pelagovum pacificum]TNY30763.1 hypothetical protein FHY64_19520 [Pelagovum pacificum]